MAFTARRRRGLIKVGVLACVACVAAAMGGCGATKEELAAKEESAQLREQNAMLQQSLRDLEARLATSDRGSGRGRSGGGGGEVIELAGNVLFDSGSATLKSSAKKALDKVYGTIRSKYAHNSIRVEGYSDSTPIKKSKWSSNQELSEARAAAVREYLVSKGVDADRISSVGYGEDRSSGKGSKQGRRVDIVILGS